MKELPILFNTEMVRAILAGNKTQTRRFKAGWKVGDVLYVRETFRCIENEIPCIQYKADLKEFWDFNSDYIYLKVCDLMNWQEESGKKDKWIPSIHMPKEFSRIRLRVTEVKTARLQEITESDAEAEGIDFLRHYPDVDETLSAIKLFCALWFSCSKPGFRWSDNPEVIVTNFERVKE